VGTTMQHPRLLPLPQYVIRAPLSRLPGEHEQDEVDETVRATLNTTLTSNHNRHPLPMPTRLWRGRSRPRGHAPSRAPPLPSPPPGNPSPSFVPPRVAVVVRPQATQDSRHDPHSKGCALRSARRNPPRAREEGPGPEAPDPSVFALGAPSSLCRAPWSRPWPSPG
jgi:hypothetical protein